MSKSNELPSQRSLITAFDPRTEEGLPTLATFLGVFAVLAFVVVLFNALAGIVGWNPISWTLSHLPRFMFRAAMSIVVIITSFGWLVGALASVKVMHLLYGWRYQDDQG